MKKTIMVVLVCASVGFALPNLAYAKTHTTTHHSVSHKQVTHKLRVTATAYNSLPSQTDKHPNLAAWSDRLVPGMKAIAVSRDLLKMGLTRGTKVRISGLKGEYVVLDKMHKRWRKRIDIYMGNNLHAAKRWGRRGVTITWSKS